MTMGSVRVKKKYQITIPKDIREKFGIKEGDRIRIEEKGKDIVMIMPEREEKPSEALWNLFGKPLEIDAVKLVEESWE